MNAMELAEQLDRMHCDRGCDECAVYVQAAERLRELEAVRGAAEVAEKQSVASTRGVLVHAADIIALRSALAKVGT